MSGKETYAPGKGYHGKIRIGSAHKSLLTDPVFAGKEPNRALGKSSLKPEDCVPDHSTLSETETKTLNDWHTFFSKRYNIVGRLPKAENDSRI